MDARFFNFFRRQSEEALLIKQKTLAQPDDARVKM